MKCEKHSARKFILLFLSIFLIFLKKSIDKQGNIKYNVQCCCGCSTKYGGIAQLARACGSYPQCRWFKSIFRYQHRNTQCVPVF